MTGYILWGKVEQLGAGRYRVVVTSMGAADARPMHILARFADSRDEAERLRDDLLMEAEAAIAARGDCVIDVEAS